jgi:hypothetical protein
MLNLRALPAERQRRLLESLRATRLLESVRQEQYGTVFVREIQNGMCVVNANALTLLLSSCDPTAGVRLYLLTCSCPHCDTQRVALRPDHPHYPRFEWQGDHWNISVQCPSAEGGALQEISVPLPVAGRP